MVEPFPFASVQELQARWPDFPPGGEVHAETLLDDASQFILDTCAGAEAAAPATRRRVVCAVVRRAMQSSADVGLSSMSETAGPFSWQRSPANPHGDFYLTKQEKLSLGCGGAQRAFGVSIAGGAGLRHRPWCSLAWGDPCSCGAVLTGDGPLWEA